MIGGIMQNNITVLSELIANGKISEAKSFIEKCPDKSYNTHYARAYRAVLLVETAVCLMNNVNNFYCDTQEITEELFKCPEQMSAPDIIDFLWEKIKKANLGSAFELYKKAVWYINENITSKQLSAETCAYALGETSVVLTRLFQKYGNITPSEYILRKRINIALSSLKATNGNVNYSANEAGFSSVGTFIRVFKRMLGTTPGKYRFMK